MKLGIISDFRLFLSGNIWVRPHKIIYLLTGHAVLQNDVINCVPVRNFRMLIRFSLLEKSLDISAFVESDIPESFKWQIALSQTILDYI